MKDEWGRAMTSRADKDKRIAAAIARTRIENTIKAADIVFNRGDEKEFLALLDNCDLDYKLEPRSGIPHGSDLLTFASEAVEKGDFSIETCYLVLDKMQAAGIDLRERRVGMNLTALMCAVLLGNLKWIERILPLSDPLQTNYLGQTAAEMAVIIDQPEIAEYIKSAILSVDEGSELRTLIPDQADSETSPKRRRKSIDDRKIVPLKAD